MALRNKKALITDDDPFVSELLAEILASEGCAVETAGDGNEAYDKFHADPHIDIVISDLNMPGMDGLQLLRKLRGENVRVPFVMLTGNNEISAAIEALRNGADDYIVKDENIQDTIVPSVKNVLAEHEFKQEKIRGHKEH